MNTNKIINCDCLEGIKKLENESIDLVVTSPPYFNAKEYSHWDSYCDYLSFLQNVFTELYTKVKDGRMVAVNISTIIIPRISRNQESQRLALPFHFVNIMEKIGYKFLEDIIWVKPEGAAKNRNGGFFQHRQPVAYKPNVVNEYIFVFQKPANFLIDKIVRGYKGKIKEQSLVKDGYMRSNVWNIQPQTSSKHLAPFPIEIPEKIILYYSYCNDIVLDPFMGSGTTAIAALKTHRYYIGFEISKEYCKMSNKRINEEVKI